MRTILGVLVSRGAARAVVAIRASEAMRVEKCIVEIFNYRSWETMGCAGYIGVIDREVVRVFLFLV